VALLTRKGVGIMGQIIAFPVRRSSEIQPKYLSDPAEIIGQTRSYYEGTGKRFPIPTPEIISGDLRKVLFLLLSFAPGRHDDIFSPLSNAIRRLAMLTVECDLTNERDGKNEARKKYS
jgi:hypothetical protein